jgi:glycosyltransferase involved in cell wall biosynthesis
VLVRDRTLTLFLSNGGSLIRWHKDGILSREILLYLHFLRTGIFDRVRIFSYHGGDPAYVKRLAATDPVYHAIEVVAPRQPVEQRGIGRILWSLWGPLRHRSRIRRSLALKTNQVSGSWSAILSHWLTGRPLVFRMGYLLSRRLRRNGSGVAARAAALIERTACNAAARVLVTSQDTAGQLGTRPAVAEKLVLTPTYVDVTAFTPKQSYDFSRSVIAVGRLTPQKNLANLVCACAEVGCGLVLVGVGECEPELRTLATSVGADVTFAGRVQNDALAERLRTHSIFVLPSLHEGLPKALIEAMACGLVCVGSDIPGVVDLIEDGRTGYLIRGFEPGDIAAALRRAIVEQRSDLGQAARAAIEDSFSLERYATREADIYRALA